MNPWILLIVAAVFGSGGYKFGSDHEIASQAREQNHIAEAVDAANATSATAISQIRVTNTTIANEVQREIQTKTVYTDCRHSPDGLRLVNEAITNAKSAGDSKLPAASPVK